MNEKTSAKVQREERRKQVFENLLVGYSYRVIAEALGVSRGTVANDARIVLGRLERDQVYLGEQYVQLELHRLDRALFAIWSKVEKGDLRAIDRMLAIMATRSRLLGKVEVKVKLSDAELLQQYVDLIAQIAGHTAGDGSPGDLAATDPSSFAGSGQDAQG